MKLWKSISHLLAGFLFAAVMLNVQLTKAAEPINGIEGLSSQATTETAGGSENSKILVEMFLSPERKGDIDTIKREFEAFSITKVRVKAFSKGDPPRNIGFGKEIPVDVAREAIRQATTYNRGIQFFLQEKRLAPHYIGIGVSIFDEAFQVPVGPDDLSRLSDPTLSTAQFHEIYHQLTDQPPRIKQLPGIKR